MHRIDSEGHSSNLFQDTTVPRTVVTDDWLNDMQENNALAIIAAGLALIKNDHTQLRTALATRHGGSTSGSYVLLLTFGDNTGTLANKIRLYSRLHTTSGSVELEILVNCSNDAGTYTPDSSGARCSRFSFGGNGFAYATFTATGTTPFNLISWVTVTQVAFNFPAEFRNAVDAYGSGSSSALYLRQSGSARGHITPIDLLATPPSTPAKGEMYVDNNAILWICTNATGPVWTKVGTQT